MTVFDFKDASLKGDRRWSSASRLTAYAPPLVLLLAILAITQIILGVIFIISIQSTSSNLTFAQVVQPLIVPGLSFFNTIPSLHLHVLARSNNPLLAMVFSSIMAALYLASAVVFLPPCAGADAFTTLRGYGGTECPVGSDRGVWAGMVALQFASALGYALHFAMAWKVRGVVKRQERMEREGIVMVVVDEEEKAKREEEARRRWREIRDL